MLSSLFLLSSSVFANSPCMVPFQKEVDIITQEIAENGSSISVNITDRLGSTIYSHNENMLMQPASVNKLFLLSAYDALVGSNSTLDTPVYELPNNRFVIQGTFDPDLDNEELNEIIATIKSKNSTINEVILVDPHLGNDTHGAGTEIDDTPYYYGAGYSGLNLNANYLNIKIMRDILGVPQLVFEGVTEENHYKIINNLKIIEENDFETLPEDQDTQYRVIRDIPNKTLILSGVLRKKLPTSQNCEECEIEEPSTSITVGIYTPHRYFKEKFIELASEQGLKIPKITLVKEFDLTEASTIYTHSTPAIEPMEKIMAKSRNHYSAALASAIAYKLGDKSDHSDNGLTYIREFIETQLDLKENSFFLHDASGLSKNNYVSSDTLAKLNNYILNHSSQEFMELWKKPAYRGYVGRALEKTDFQDYIYAKPGTLSFVSSFSGFYMNPEHEPFSFSVVINNSPLSSTERRAEIMKVVDHLHNFSECTIKE